MKKCKHCSQEITKDKRNIYCSRSCAITVNNTKRKISVHCSVCNTQVERNDSGIAPKYCIDCRYEKLSIDNHTIKDLLLPGSNKFRKVRSNAKIKMNNSDIPRICANCGYDKYVEVAHLKGLASFPHTALVKEVNKLDNLRYLCPNCHWEHDNLIDTI
jgi:hypothetical protein